MGFRDEIKQILEYLPGDRQTLLFSATGKSYSMAQFKALTKNQKTGERRQLHIITDETEEQAVLNSDKKLDKNGVTQPDELKQVYMKVKAEDKINFLFNFLKNKQ